MIKPYFETENGVLYNADCLEILPQLEPVDLILTDPPYGVTQNKWDKLQITIDVFDMLLENNIVFTCQNPSTAILINRYLKKFKWSDVWHKSQAVGFLNAKIMPLRQHEDIVVLSKEKMTYFPQIQKKHPADIRPHGKTKQSKQSKNYGPYNNERIRTIPINKSYPRSVVYFENSQGGNHPNRKPTQLFLYLIKTYSKDIDIILDPFLGSGTTAVACERLGRRWIGIEISEQYCEISAKRIEAENKQLKIPGC